MFDVKTGDCLDIMRAMPDASVDAIVTDPPYGLGKQPDAVAMLRDWLAGEAHRVAGGGFMGKRWDAFVPGPDVWRECLRVLKPGGHAVVFAGSRTVDLMGLAMRIAGFEIRDQLQWLYGTGFPKSLDVSKAIDKAAGAEREVVGVSSVTGSRDSAFAHERDDSAGGFYGDASVNYATAPATPEAAQWDGFGTALKPAHEPIILARKPLSGTVAATVLEHGTGALNIDGCRVGGPPPSVPNPVFNSPTGNVYGYQTGEGRNGEMSQCDKGRWPANVILDDEAGALLDMQAGEPQARFFYCPKASTEEREAGLDGLPVRTGAELTASKEGQARLDSPRTGAGRGGGRRNMHPTVKPIDLMRWLCRLITPPGGLILDPFTGSGTTGCAAMLEGFGFIGCELSEEHADVARRRIRYWGAKAGQLSPDEVPAIDGQVRLF
jgi:site-specific DNA-methyltransferase (adenine-specific)